MQKRVTTLILRAWGESQPWLSGIGSPVWSLSTAAQCVAQAAQQPGQVLREFDLGQELLRFCCLPAHTSLLKENCKLTLGHPRVWLTELQGWRWELGTSMGRGFMLLRMEPSLSFLTQLNHASPHHSKGEDAFQPAFHTSCSVPHGWVPCVSHGRALSRGETEGQTCADKSHTGSYRLGRLHQGPWTTVLHPGDGDMMLDNSTADHSSTQKESAGSAKKLFSLWD